MESLALPHMISKLMRELEGGGFDRFFQTSGGEALHYAYVLEEMSLYGGGIEASALFWEALFLVGPEEVWKSPALRTSAIAALSSDDRKNLRNLTDQVLDYIYDMEFILDC